MLVSCYRIVLDCYTLQKKKQKNKKAKKRYIHDLFNNNNNKNSVTLKVSAIWKYVVFPKSLLTYSCFWHKKGQLALKLQQHFSPYLSC